MVLPVLLALLAFQATCKDEGQHVASVYVLDRGVTVVSNEFTFVSDGETQGEYFPLPFLHFAGRANFSEFTFQLVQGRWNDYVRPFFPHGLDHPIVRSSLKSALGFNMFDGGLTFIGKRPLDTDKIINYIGNFLCSGIDRLLRNVVRLKVPSPKEEVEIDYAADPMSYLCYDNLAKFLNLIAPNKEELLAKMIDKIAFGNSPHTHFHIIQQKDKSSTLLKVRILFVVPQQNATTLQLVPLLPSSRLRVYSRSVKDFEQADLVEPVPLSSILDKQLPPVAPSLEPISIQRHITGIDHELYAQYHLSVHNQAASPVKVWLQEYLPYFLKPYFHTLKLTSEKSNRTLVPLQVVFNNKSDCYFYMGDLVVMPNETVKISMNIEKTILPFEQYPHDSSRGFDLPQMIFFYQSLDKGLGITHVPSIVMMMPQPDFSMPFNVHAICATLIGALYKLYVTIVDYLN